MMKKGSRRKMIYGILTGIIVLLAGGVAYVYFHPQIIVGLIQSMMYQGAPVNSFEPFHEPVQCSKEDGSWYVSEIAYGTQYPNSYLDITYPDSDIRVRRPTVVYFHGGGYFGGDKSMGDPLAVDNDANRLFQEIVANGYNFVNVNYALVPECRFPVPLEQMVEALEFLKENADEYGLDMGNVVIFGQSAGAILTSQYGALLVSEEYRQKLGLYPTLQNGEIKALIIDDAPLVFSNFNIKLKLLIGNYLGSMRFDGDAEARYNPIGCLNGDFAPTFLTAGNTDGFPEDMQEFSDRLTELAVENEYYRIEREEAELAHGYLGLVDSNLYARECFDRILAFMEKYTK